MRKLKGWPSPASYAKGEEKRKAAKEARKGAKEEAKVARGSLKATEKGTADEEAARLRRRYQEEKDAMTAELIALEQSEAKRLEENGEEQQAAAAKAKAKKEKAAATVRPPRVPEDPDVPEAKLPPRMATTYSFPGYTPPTNPKKPAKDQPFGDGDDEPPAGGHAAGGDGPDKEPPQDPKKGAPGGGASRRRRRRRGR